MARFNLNEAGKTNFLRGMNYALRNARELLSEASTLYRKGAYRRAVSLSVLALEEAGKVVFLVMCFNEERSTTPKRNLDELWRHFYSHKTKVRFFNDYDSSQWKLLLYVKKRKHNESAVYIRKVIRPLLVANTSVYSFMKRNKIRSIGDLKLRCIYVDVSKDGMQFVLPCSVPAEVAKSMMIISKAHIHDAASIRDSFRRSRTTRLSDNIIDIVTRDFQMEKIGRELSKKIV